MICVTFACKRKEQLLEKLKFAIHKNYRNGPVKATPNRPLIYFHVANVLLAGLCAYLDIENAMDCSLAESIGTPKPFSFRIPIWLRICYVLLTLTKSGYLDGIVIDSLPWSPSANLILKLIVNTEMHNQESQPKHYEKYILINQIRSSSKSGKEFGPMGEVTCGGNALKLYAGGLGISVQVVKNNLAPAMKKPNLGIQFERGLGCESEVLQLACEHGVIAKEGSNYHIGQKDLAKNDALFYEVVTIFRKILFER
ncbi:hypothetical protein DVH24_042756 [Malus domestica]|uniref:Uncharacterized protein n=1 Tax=Malus domestica TaxID=3750 RepID=A0A498HZA2_MALDO|nr:hypothetical protein DVH24_042756 [Malus domestica]